MKGLKKRRRVQLAAICAASLLAATGLIGYGMRDGIAYFRSPSQVLHDVPAATETFRIGGLVEHDSVVFDDRDGVRFSLTDGAASIGVSYAGILPDLFAEGQGAIALGKYAEGTFTATEILAKHDEKYLPKEVAEALKEAGVFRGPQD